MLDGPMARCNAVMLLLLQPLTMSIKALNENGLQNVNELHFHRRETRES